MGFVPDRNNMIITVILCIITGGSLLFLLSWKPSIRLRFTHIPCPIKDAKVLLITDIHDVVWEEQVSEEEVTIKDANAFRRQIYFYNKKIKYVWDIEVSAYSRVLYPMPGTRLSKFPTQIDGLNSLEARERKLIFGENNIAIETPTIWTLFVNQAFNPFYIFQLYTIVIWCLQGYFTFSACIFLMSIISIGLNIFETRRQTKILREKMTTKSKVRVIRDNHAITLESTEIVPGDVCIIVSSEDLLEADMVLLEGSTIMNEAILTGESVPVTKVKVTAIDEEIFDIEKHKFHILHGGTQVLQVRGANELRAVVVRTGYNSIKGEMIRSILFPKPMGFKIYSDFLKLIFIFIVLGIAATIWSLIHWSQNEAASWTTVLFKSLDLMTFVIPPIIPATITSINLWAQKRLQKEKIYCLSSNYIALAGATDIICFDKTGTLTEEDLSLEGLIPSEDGLFLPPLESLETLSESSSMCRTLASCHSIAQKDDGKYIGHPLDIKIFTALHWKIKSSPIEEDSNLYEMDPLFVVAPNLGSSQSETEIAILKSYPFDSTDQRMTVIGQEKCNDHYEVFIKGAPEKVVSLCTPFSVPLTFKSMLEWYTKQGLRVIAAASSTLPLSYTWKDISSTSREELEENSTFLGLIILQNRLKKETSPAIKLLHDALLTTVMVTGDNLLTATCVARQCGLVRPEQQLIFVKAEYVASSTKAVKHLRIHFYDSQQDTEIFIKGKLKSVVHPDFVFGTDGESFQLIYQYDKEIFKKLIHRGRIFARMKPDQKITVIESLQSLGHQVAMCGDGCNDCGALKAAHSGISLSSTEASVAAPFTSIQQDISCVSNLIREGRATLISTYASFKYNIAYCFSLLIVVLIIFTEYTEPSDAQYLIMDLVIITVPSLVMGNTGASNNLCSRRPTRRIIHPIHIVSILVFLAVQSVMYWTTYDYLKRQSWYVPYNYTGDTLLAEPTYIGTVLIIEACFSFPMAAVAFSHGYPFRKPIYENKILTGYLLFLSCLCTFFVFCNASWLMDLLTFQPIYYSGFKWTIFFIIILSGLVCYILERWILYGIVEHKVIPFIMSYMDPIYPYEHLERQIRESPMWPKLETNSYNDDSNESADDVEEEFVIHEVYDEPLDSTKRYFRKSTKHHKFLPTDVKFVDEIQDLTYRNKIIYRTSSKEYEIPIKSSVPPKKLQEQQSIVEYVDPQDTLSPPEEPKESPECHYQRSFRSQLFKGKKNGDMQTFGRKQQTPKEEVQDPRENVVAYEIVPLPYTLNETKDPNEPDQDSDHDSVTATVEDNDIQSPMSDCTTPNFHETFSSPLADGSIDDNLNTENEQNDTSEVKSAPEVKQDWNQLTDSIYESIKELSIEENK